MRKKSYFRTAIQAVSTVFSNGYLAGFAKLKIFTGASKHICVPGLNCYSCPGALFACPLGSLQSSLAGGEFRFPLYMLGFIFIVGALLGRFVCGWLCPFGFIQELLHKLPFVKKLRRLPGDRALKWLKYLLLALLCVILPLTLTNIVGQGSPWFCKLVCPAGTLEAGLPLVLFGEGYADAAGVWFFIKVIILIVIVLLSVIVYRPFCRYLCPLGAIYGLFNPISLYKLKLNPRKCTSCGACRTACRLDIAAFKNPNSVDCIRCGDCVAACPHGALSGPRGFKAFGKSVREAVK